MRLISNNNNRQERLRNTALICALSILINVLGSYLASRLGLPLYLDSIGTILAAAVGGIVPGTITGFLTNLFKGFWDLSSIYYMPINILLAFGSAFFARRNALLRFPQLLLSCVCLALVGGGIGSFLTWYLNGCVLSGDLPGRFLTLGLSPLSAQLAGDFLLDLADKGISLLVVIGLINLLSKADREALARQNLSLQGDKNTVRTVSLRAKVMLMIAGLMLVIAVGCTGGRHRSVAIAAALTEYLKAKGINAENVNRDIKK